MRQVPQTRTVINYQQSATQDVEESTQNYQKPLPAQHVPARLQPNLPPSIYCKLQPSDTYISISRHDVVEVSTPNYHERLPVHAHAAPIPNLNVNMGDYHKLNQQNYQAVNRATLAPSTYPVPIKLDEIGRRPYSLVAVLVVAMPIWYNNLKTSQIQPHANLS